MVFNFSDNSLDSLNEYLDFDSSLYPETLEVKDLEPVNLNEVNFSILNENINENSLPPEESNISQINETLKSVENTESYFENTDKGLPMTVSQELSEVKLEDVPMEDSTFDKSLEMLPSENNVVGEALSLNEVNNTDINQEVSLKIQSGGGDKDYAAYNNLTRVNIINIKENKENYIICQIKDIFYDDKKEVILRNYGIRKITLTGEVVGDIKNITSEDITEVRNFTDLNLRKEDVQYQNPDHKEEDTKISKEYQELEEIDPTLEGEEEDEAEEEDLNIMVEQNSTSKENNVDEESFEFEEFNDTIVLEVIQELEENKILFTENEQEEDIIEELIRLLPKRKRNNNQELKKIINKVRVFKYLKAKYSKSNLANENTTEEEFDNLKQQISIKGRNYKPLVKKYVEGDFSNKLLLPIISVEEKQYEEISNNVRKNIQTKKLGEGDENYPDYLSELEKLDKIYKRYKEDSDLDYDNKIKEINNLFWSTKPVLTNSFYKTIIDNDTRTVKNFKELQKISISNQLGSDFWTDEYFTKHISSLGSSVHINGFFLNKNQKKNFLLERTEITNYSQNILDNLTISKNSIVVNHIDNDSIYQKGDKVRVCINENGENLEILGKVRASKKNFIYVEPNDKKLIDSDSQILEFDTTLDKDTIVIDKISEIKNANVSCFDKENNNFYLFNMKEQLKKRNLKNILEQIVPSINQILKNEDIKHTTFIGQVDEILSKYDLTYADLEISNYKFLNSIINKNVVKINKKYEKKTERINNIKRTYDRLFSQILSEHKKRDFEFVNNKILEEVVKIYDNYNFRENSFDNEEVRTEWIMSQDDFGKAFAFTLINEQIKSHRLQDKIGVLQEHKQKLEEVSNDISQKLEEEIRKNDFFTNPDNICKEGIVSKITKIYLSISKLDQDNFKDVLVDAQFKTILEEESVKIGDFCILKDSNNPSIDPQQVDLSDRIFERVIGEDKRPLWKEKSKGFLTDYIREYKKICQEKGEECKFTNSFGPCEPEVIKRLKQNKKENQLEIEKISKKILDIRDRKKELEVDKKFKYYVGRELLNKQNREQQRKIKEQRMDEFRKSILLDIDKTEMKDFDDLEKMREDLKDPEKREAILVELKRKYDIDFIDYQTPDDVIEQTQDGDFNEAGQRIVYAEVMNQGEETLELSDNDIIDSVRSFLINAIDKENPNLEEELDTIKNIMQVFLRILGVNIETKNIELKALNLFNSSIISFKKWKDQFKKKVKGKEAEAKYQEFRIENLIFYTTTLLLIELQINLNNYFMSHYESCISSIDGFPIIPEEEETKVGERFNYGINFFVCILNNLKEGDGYWSSIKNRKKNDINKSFKAVLKSIANNREYKNQLQKKREKLEKHKDLMDKIEQSYLWNEFRPYLKKIDRIDEPANIDLNDCDISDKSKLQKTIKLANDRNKWYAIKIFDKINSIIQGENIENIKYDPLPIGNTCCMDIIDNNYDYYNFLHEKDSSKELKDLIQKSKELEDRCSHNTFKLCYVKPTMIRPKLKSYYLEVFPDRETIDKKIIGKMFTNFVPAGFNQGKKRIFQNVYIRGEDMSPQKIDVLTNENREDLKGEHTVEDFYNLLESVHSENKIIEPVEEPIEEDFTRFKLIKIVNDFKIVLDNEYFRENKYVRDLLDTNLEVLFNGTDRDVKNIWDRLGLEIDDVKETLLNKFVMLKSEQKNKLSKIIDNLDNFELTDKSDETTFENKKKISIEKKKRKENCYKDYFINYLRKFVAILSNKNNKNIRKEDDESFDNFSEFAEFLSAKNAKIFKKLKKFTNKLSIIKKLKGYDDIYDCESKHILDNSRFNYNNCNKMLKFLFILSLQIMVNMSDNKRNENQEDSDDENQKENITPGSLSDDEEDTPGLVLENDKVVLQFIRKILEKIDKDRRQQDKYNAKNNTKEIKTRNELNKDENLRVMQLLDLETRRLRNEQTKAGLRNYADLSKDFENVLERDEMEQNIRSQLGPDATDEQVENAIKQREIDRYEQSQIEVFNTSEGDDEMNV